MTEPPLVGRDETLRSVEEHLRQRRAVVLTGQAGIGKSRLAREAVRRIRADGVRVVEAQGDQVSREVPLGAFAFLLHPGARPNPDVSAALWEIQIALLGGDGRKVLLYVDDAHLLDPLSVMLVMRVARSSEARLLFTVRLGEDIPPALVDLWSEGSVERVQINALDREPLEEMASDLLGAPPAPKTALELRRVSEGNPLCLRELVLHAKSRDAVVVRGGQAEHTEAFSAGERLSEIIGARLASLPESAADGLHLLAVSGALPLDTLERSLPEGAVEDLERRSLARISTNGGRRTVTTTHPLYGEVMAETMGEATRATAAARLYDATFGVPSRRAGDLVDRATWGLAGGRSVDPHTLRAAAGEALAGHSAKRAETFARASLAGQPLSGTAVVLAEALVYQGRLAEAEDAFEDASRTARDADEGAAVALVRAQVDALSGRDILSALRRLDEAYSEELAPGMSDALAAQRGFILMMSSSQDEAMVAVQPVIDRDPPADDSTLILALGVAISSRAWAGRVSESLSLGDVVAGLTAEHRGLSLIHVMPGMVMRTYALYSAGRYEEAVGIFSQAREQFPGLESIIDVGEGLCHVSAGHPAPGLALLEPGCLTVEALGDPLRQVGWSTALMLDGGLMAGRSADELTPLRDRLLQLPPQERGFFDPEIERVLGVWSANAGDDSAALKHFRTAVEGARMRGMLTFAANALDDLARFGWAAEASAVAAGIAAQADPEWKIAHGVARQAEALAARDAIALSGVADEYASWGWKLRAAEICAESSAIFRELDDAANAYRQELRSRALAGQVEGADTLLLRRRKLTLGDRADQLAHMVAEGMSNPEIAEKLVLSRRTVENHLYRVYRDLGMSGREELAELVNSAHRSVGVSDAPLGGE